jgi:hypothetical protein
MPTNAVSTTFVLVTQKCFSARNRDKFKFMPNYLFGSRG